MSATLYHSFAAPVPGDMDRTHTIATDGGEQIQVLDAVDGNKSDPESATVVGAA